MRYKVYTFRGWEEYRFYDFAYGAAIKMIDSIKADKWCEEYWWAYIYDTHKGLRQLIWLRGNYCYQKTQWLIL